MAGMSEGDVAGLWTEEERNVLNSARWIAEHSQTTEAAALFSRDAIVKMCKLLVRLSALQPVERDGVIEECAKVAEECAKQDIARSGYGRRMSRIIAKAIRALKALPSPPAEQEKRKG